MMSFGGESGGIRSITRSIIRPRPLAGRSRRAATTPPMTAPTASSLRWSIRFTYLSMIHPADYDNGESYIGVRPPPTCDSYQAELPLLGPSASPEKTG
jgi:hypothetical protein